MICCFNRMSESASTRVCHKWEERFRWVKITVWTRKDTRVWSLDQWNVNNVTKETLSHSLIGFDGRWFPTSEYLSFDLFWSSKRTNTSLVAFLMTTFLLYIDQSDQMNKWNFKPFSFTLSWKVIGVRLVVVVSDGGDKRIRSSNLRLDKLSSGINFDKSRNQTNEWAKRYWSFIFV